MTDKQARDLIQAIETGFRRLEKKLSEIADNTRAPQSKPRFENMAVNREAESGKEWSD